MNSAKWWTAGTLALVLLVGGVTVTMASSQHRMGMNMGEGTGNCQGTAEGNMPMNRTLEKMTKVLDLSADQQVNIREIMTSHHEQAGNHHEAMQGMHNVMAEQKSGAFDENEVRKAAKLSGAAHEERMVSRAKMQNEIYAVLTAEQRELSEKLEMTACDGRRHGGARHAGMM